MWRSHYSREPGYFAYSPEYRLTLYGAASRVLELYKGYEWLDSLIYTGGTYTGRGLYDVD